MHDATDLDLLREYAVGNSEAAFEVLISRHVNLVYSAALRKTGNSHAAVDITQAVFIILAQKAGRLPDGTILAGWLYQTARFTAASFLKHEARRVRREQEAYMQTEIQATTPDETWEQLAPLLEDAMGQLGYKDRSAVVLRFFSGKSFAEIGTAIGVSENAARKRVNYALEKLHRYFCSHGVSSTTAIIGGVISANSVQIAPATLAKAVFAVTTVKGVTASGSTLALIKGAMKIMAWSKTKTAIAVGAILLLAGGTVFVTVKEVTAHASAADGAVALIVPGTSVGGIRAGMSTDQLLLALGKPDRVSHRTDTTGEVWEYARLGFSASSSIHGVDRVTCGDVSGSNNTLAKACKVYTEEGIGMGSTRTEVQQAFNQPDTVEALDAKVEQLGYKSFGLTFTLRAGKVIGIVVDFPAITGANPWSSLYFIRDEIFFSKLRRATNAQKSESNQHALRRYFISNNITPPPAIWFDEPDAARQGIKNIVRVLGTTNQAGQIRLAMAPLLRAPKQP